MTASARSPEGKRHSAQRKTSPPKTANISKKKKEQKSKGARATTRQQQKLRRAASRKTAAVPRSRKRQTSLARRPPRAPTQPSRRERVSALTRSSSNPLIAPQPHYAWESWQTFNPAAVLVEDRIHFFYRAIGYDGVSRIGYASSYDGFTLAERLTSPVFAHPTRGSAAVVRVSGSSGGSWSGAEDPRAVYIAEDDTIYLTYTACGESLGVGLTTISRADLLAKQWRWQPPRVISPPHETHKNWVIFPQRIRGQYAILTSLSPRVLVHYRPSMTFAQDEWIESVYTPQPLTEGWGAYIRGAGPPPLPTPYGWLLFYHAVARNAPGIYKLGALLLDYANPTVILRRAPQPILEPQEVYEWNGHKPGVVYATGAVILGSTLLLYYGAADTYVGVAYAPAASFLESLIQGGAPRLAYRRVQQRRAAQ
ncbi:MAG: hypothetical protein KatS3mg100_098 [Candidatus Parcubacteria bacterium]|nr:MAG: hypothetical protein KatS3mg100_098 [Candidatus Parcubacteria bacterium]